MTIDSVNDLVNTYKPANSIPKIYFACLAAYNVGIIHGAWIDVTQAVAAIHLEVQAMLADSPIPNAKEWMLHSNVKANILLIAKDANIEEIHNRAIFIQKHGELALALLMHYGDVEQAENAVIAGYCGKHGSELDFAMDEFQAFYMDAPIEEVHPYINYQAFLAQELKNKFLFLHIGGKVHVFDNT